MKRQIRTLAIAAVFSAICCTPAQAGTQVTTVTGDYSATNGCSVISIGGYGGPGFNVVVWGISCPNDSITVERVDYWTEWGNWCEMRNPSSGYYITGGGCGNYSIWKY